MTNWVVILGGESAPPYAAVLTWDAPTTNTDGSALTGDDAIADYRVAWREGGIFINSARVGSPTTALNIDVLPAGTLDFDVTAIAVDGEESDPWYIGQKVIP